MKGTNQEQFTKMQDANKQLRAQVRQLRKENKAFRDELALLQDIWQAEIMELKAERRERLEEKRIPVCPKCGNPTLLGQQMGAWILEKCASCDYFSREKE